MGTGICWGRGVVSEIELWGACFPSMEGDGLNTRCLPSFVKNLLQASTNHVCCGCLCSGEGRKRSQLSIPATSIYTLGGHDITLANMVGIVKPPGGAPEPCLLTKKPDGKLGIRTSTFQQCSRIRISRFFSDFKKHDFLRFLMTCQKNVKSR